MADRQNITLRICGKDYPVGIDPKDEELYRIAADMVNRKVADYARRTPVSLNYSAKDYLALTAFMFACDSLEQSRSREVGNEDVVELEKISESINDYMNRLADK